VSGPETLAEKAGIDLRLAGLGLGVLVLGAAVRGEGPGEALAAACLVDGGAEAGGAGLAQPVARRIATLATAIAAARGLVTPPRVRGPGHIGRPSIDRGLSL
jgi:hypothetical protein